MRTCVVVCAVLAVVGSVCIGAAVGAPIATPAKTDFGPCVCDVTAGVCDMDVAAGTGCCCDPSCPDSALAYFNASGLACAPSPALSAADARLCVNRDKVRASNGLDATWFGDVLCVTANNYPSDGFFYPVPPPPLSSSAAAAILGSRPLPLFQDPTATPAALPTLYPPGASVLAVAASASSSSSLASLAPRGSGAACALSPLAFLADGNTACAASLAAGCGVSASTWADLTVLPSPTSGASAGIPLAVVPVCYDSADRSTRAATACPAGGVAALDAVADGNGGCAFVVTDLAFAFEYTGDFRIQTATVTVGVANTTAGAVEVRVATAFSPSDAVAEARSGNPGYVTGLPVRGGVLAGDGLSVAAAALTVGAGDAYGQCVPPAVASAAAHAELGFGVDSVSACTISVSAADLSDCTALRDRIVGLLLPAAAPDVVAAWGASATTEPSDWTPLTKPTDVPTAAGGTGVCADLVVGVHYGFVTVAGGAATNPQRKLIGAQMEYLTASVAAPGVLTLSSSAAFVSLDSPSPEEAFPRNPNLIPELPSDVWYPFRLGSPARATLPLPLLTTLALSVLVVVLAEAHL